MTEHPEVFECVVFLDIDGAVSPVAGAHMGPLPDTWPAWIRLDRMFPVFVAPECIARLTRLAVRRVWCSTWEAEVERPGGLSEQLGWAGMPWLRLPASGRPWNKRQAIECWLTANGVRPFIWVDDDRRLVSSGRPWARRLPVRSLLIRPEKRIGLTPAHLAAMEKFVEEVNGAGARPLPGDHGEGVAAQSKWVAVGGPHL